MSHDPTIHSKDKLGAVGSVPLLPMMPTAAQVFSPVQVHYRLLGESYVVGILPSVPPSKIKAVLAAVKAIPATDPSYSGSGTLYRALVVVPSADGRTFTVLAGETVIGIGLVDPTAEIVSTDESLESQL
jgi:hypothetical protein